MSSTPKITCQCGSSNASGGMYASVPGHMVKEVKVVKFVSKTFAIPKPETLALLPAPISNMVLLERSQCMIPFE